MIQRVFLILRQVVEAAKALPILRFPNPPGPDGYRLESAASRLTATSQLRRYAQPNPKPLWRSQT